MIEAAMIWNEPNNKSHWDPEIDPDWSKFSEMGTLAARAIAEVAPVRPDYDFFEQDHFDAPGYPKMHFIEHHYAKDPTNWWAPNAACSMAMLRSSGFEVLEHPEPEVYLCRKKERPADWYGPVYPARPGQKGNGR